MSDGPIRLTGIRFARGGRTILDGLDLTIPLGRSTALVAPSGAGKSTLLALIAGLVEPDAGHVSTPFTRGGDRPRAPGLRAGRAAHGRRERRGRTASPPRAAPGGDPPAGRSRCSSRCTSPPSRTTSSRSSPAASSNASPSPGPSPMRPRLLIADEFTAELDRSNRDEIADLVFSAAAHGTTVVIATHDPLIAERCDLVIPLD